MPDVIRIEEMDVSEDEKKLIIRALHDKAFREKLKLRASGQSDELSDDEMEAVTGGAGRAQPDIKQIAQVLETVRDIEGQMDQGAMVLCSGPNTPSGEHI